jgi:hypothetical protein
MSDERDALKAAFHVDEDGEDAEFFVAKTESEHMLPAELTEEERYVSCTLLRPLFIGRREKICGKLERSNGRPNRVIPFSATTGIMKLNSMTVRSF